MNKAQIGLIGIGILMVVGLFALPKSVVNTRNAVAQVGNENKTKTEEHSENDGHDHSKNPDFHQVSLSEAEQKTLSEQIEFFEKAKIEKEKKAFFEKIKSFFEKTNRYDSTAVYAEKIARQFPTIENWVQAGENYLEGAKFAVEPTARQNLAQKARFFLEKAFAEKPEQTDLKVKIGSTYVFGENPMQGIMMIREVAEKEPENRLANLQLGIFAIQSGQFAKGIERFEKLLKQDSEDWEAQFYLGVCLLETQKNAEAKPYFEKVVAKSTDRNIKLAAEEYLEQLK